MKFYHYFMMALAMTACSSQQLENPDPVFESFHYVGNDARYNQPFNSEIEYLNPVISGTNPDPAVCRKGDDFYMANSSFVYWPGIPVWHSRDLIDWDFCGYVIDRRSQSVFVDGIRISGGVYAPDIKYCEKNQTFYLIVTLVDGLGNVIFKSKNPYEGWSEPIPVPEVHGIDPSFLFDNDGKCYIINNDEPAYPAEYSGHRAIWGRLYDLNTDKVCGEPVVLIDKGIRPAENPIWIEGPHLYHFTQKKSDRLFDQYYLMDAEGGTGTWHSEVVLAGKSPLGKFTPCQQNPILTQRTQPHDRLYPVSCAGHADLVNVRDEEEIDNNEWWSLFLACTTYDGDQLYNTGRSTFLLPATWQRDPVNGGIQPLILHPDSLIPTVCPKSEWQKSVAEAMVFSQSGGVGGKSDSRNLLTGNGSYADDFSGDTLYPLWFTLRTPDPVSDHNQLAPWCRLTNPGLQLTGRPVKLSQKGQPSLLCRWVKNSIYSVQTRMRYNPSKPNAMAGLTLFQTEEAHYVVAKRMNEQGALEMVLLKSDKEATDIVVGCYPISAKEATSPVELRAEVDQHVARFSYSFDAGKTWIFFEDVNADILTTQYAGGFTGCVAGLYAYVN